MRSTRLISRVQTRATRDANLARLESLGVPSGQHSNAATVREECLHRFGVRRRRRKPKPMIGIGASDSLGSLGKDKRIKLTPFSALPKDCGSLSTSSELATSSADSSGASMNRKRQNSLGSGKEGIVAEREQDGGKGRKRGKLSQLTPLSKAP